MESIINLIGQIDTPEAKAVVAEVEAELAKGREKAEENRALYAEMHDTVMETIKGATGPVTVQEIVNATGLPQGKVTYGLTRLWKDEIEVIPGKVNSYTAK